MPVLAGPAPSAVPEYSLDLPTVTYLAGAGIVMDGSTVDAGGCVWKRIGDNVWGAKPAPREAVGDRAQAHGQWDATRHYGPRVVPFRGSCRAPSHAALHLAEQRLRDAVGVAPSVLRATEPGFDSFAVVRQQGELTWTENSHGPGYAHASFAGTLYAADPVIYSSMERSFTTRFPQSTGGLRWAPTVRWAPTQRWSGQTISGRVTLTNPGNQPAPLRLRIDGPAQTVAVALEGVDQTLYLEDPDGAAILRAGEHLIVDTGTHDVLLMGDASRRAWAYGAWPKLPPLDDTDLVIAGTGVDLAVSTVSGTYRTGRI